ncbi:uncharacterized protein LOC126553264 [Aphis gossypii]|uniref:uncharacterized protein LOC126550479 n=1 Tax=Aphis gossypii TaxID=80765 RepID=UPI002159903D|nr:uncharacterized protein LOC126550479 [Aphis gossypii]XP_050064369.1 uncharacterized protein LOC126553264 [Aphis gossypii]
MEDVTMCDVNKRQRGKNFTEHEKEVLIDLILPYKAIIENVKTDAVWNNKKNEAWSEIVVAYNANQTSGVRNIAQIKHLYDTQKRKARKEKSQYKVQHYKTGGGKNASTLSDVTQKVIGLLGDRMDPLLNNVDCDAGYNASEDITFLSGDQIIVEEISGDELSFHCSSKYIINKINLMH